MPANSITQIETKIVQKEHHYLDYEVEILLCLPKSKNKDSFIAPSICGHRKTTIREGKKCDGYIQPSTMLCSNTTG